MTDKQEKILRATALDLFANTGYNAASTSKIAQKASVSEGLIFRHCQNKKGLLDALVLEAAPLEAWTHRLHRQTRVSRDCHRCCPAHLSPTHM